MFPKAPVWTGKAFDTSKGGGANAIKIRKVLDVERRELTEKLFVVNIL